MSSLQAPASHAAPSGESLFQHWLSACGSDPWTPLSEAASTPYRFIWGAWLKFLAGSEEPVDTQTVLSSCVEPTAAEHAISHQWQQAEAVQVLQFLNQSTRSQKQLDLPSDITRRRYWRVLERIYDHALLHEWIAHSPLDGIAAQERPPSEDPQGAILSPRMWRALQRQIPAATDLISARDRAVLLVLVHLGLSSEEVRGLVLDDLVWSSTDDGSATLEAPKAEARIQSLRITGLRAMQARTLEVPSVLADALHTWLAYLAGYAAMAGQPALFCTRKAPELSTHTVLHLVTKTLQAASARYPQEEPLRMGPQVIRNTLIVRWLQSGMDEAAVLQRAGLKTPHALGHLRHFMD